MIYLFWQTLFWLVLALLLGLILGWLLRGMICGSCNRGSDSTKENSNAPPASSATRPTAAANVAPADGASTTITDDMKPAALNGPNGAEDDLKRISGIGPVIKKTLNGLGIYHFTQIAEFSEDNITWVDNYIDFPGRIKREKWLTQATKLAEGKETEFAQRYDRGEVGDDNPNN